MVGLENQELLDEMWPGPDVAELKGNWSPDETQLLTLFGSVQPAGSSNPLSNISHFALGHEVEADVGVRDNIGVVTAVVVVVVVVAVVVVAVGVAVAVAVEEVE